MTPKAPTSALHFSDIPQIWGNAKYIQEACLQPPFSRQIVQLICPVLPTHHLPPDGLRTRLHNPRFRVVVPACETHSYSISNHRCDHNDRDHTDVCPAFLRHQAAYSLRLAL